MKEPRLGIYLFNLRKMAGLTKSKAVEKLNIDTSIIESWEAGMEIPSVSYSGLISQAYDVPEKEIKDILEIENAAAKGYVAQN